MWNASNESGLNKMYQVISLDQRNLILTFSSTLFFLVALVGLITNILTICTVCRISQYSPMHIALITISVNDLTCGCIFIAGTVVMMNISGLLDLGVDLTDVLYILGPIFMGLTALGSWVTAIVNVERCCWIVPRERRRKIFTRKRNLSLIFVMFAIQVASITASLSQKNLSTNTLAVDGRKRVVVDRSELVGTVYVDFLFLTAAVTELICFVIIVSAISFLTFQLIQKDRWLNARGCLKKDLIKRARGDVSAIIKVSVLYVASRMPGLITMLLILFFPVLKQFDPISDNLLFVLASYIGLCQLISDVMNFFLYLKIIPKFRKCLNELLFPEPIIDFELV